MHIDPHRRYFLGHFRLPRCTYEYSYIALGQRRLRSLKAGRLDTQLWASPARHATGSTLSERQSPALTQPMPCRMKLAAGRNNVSLH